MEKKKRPVGLIVLAVINFVLAFFGGVFILLLYSRSLLSAGGLSLNPYTLFSPLVTSILLVVSGIGFIDMSRKMGYFTGNAFCILSILNIFIFNATQGFSQFATHLPSLVYPIVLFSLLNFKYKRYF
ncbi:hypothetical protein BVX98_05790 [bacterium F11]|nr:hypothetical protein BVX98_05790 [bacterium F11]